MKEVQLERDIERLKCHVATLHSLPDKGEKLRLHLQRLQAELDWLRKPLPPLPLKGDGSEKLTEPERNNLTSVPDDFTETTPSNPQVSQSGFCTLLDKKLEKKRKDKRTVRARQKSDKSIWQSLVPRSNKLSLNADTLAISNDDENGHCSPSDEKISLKKRLRNSPSLASKDSSQSNEDTFVFLDDEGHGPDTEQAEEVDKCLKNSKVYYPARNDPECVEICYQDMQCLAPQAFLSSTIMNFYIRHLQEPKVAAETKSTDYLFFNTYFYNKLQEAVSKKDEKESLFSKLRRWWKGVNIFQKAYILFPVHKDLHWSLVIVCIPDKEDNSGPIILHLDSLGLHSSRPILRNVKSFLIEEWKHLNEGEVPLDVPISDQIWKNLSRGIKEKEVKVPQQRNEYDCGLFVLYFIERFISDAPERLKKKDLAMFGTNWFRPNEASRLRQKIKKLLMKEFKKPIQNDEE